VDDLLSLQRPWDGWPGRSAQDRDARREGRAEARNAARPCRDDGLKGVDRPQQIPGPEIVDRCQLELETGGDADATPAAVGPDRGTVGLIDGVVRGAADVSGSIDKIDRDQRAGRETVRPRQPSRAPAERETRHGHIRGGASAAEQPDFLRRAIDRAPCRPGSHPRDPTVRIDLYRVEP